ncbi:MAG: hypothetical protein NTV09_01005 [Bacteroidetes bacterium]|nr:hypothetical protein [Bacteroidota bacterium]
MIKIISIAISAMVVLLVSLFGNPENEISITSSVAPRLVPGDECTVTVTLNKGTATGYARLQQILPMGLTATPVETMGAKFEMEGNVVKFEWTSLPDAGTFAVSYKFHTDPNESDRELMPGSFYYIKDDQRVKIELAPVELDFTVEAATKNDKEVERKIFAVTPEGGEYKIVLNITRRSGEHTARFIDEIPAGYTVTNVNSGGAKFMFSNQQATFLWNQLPEEPVIKVSYNLQATGDEFESPIVSGMLVYGGDDESKTSIESATTELSGNEATRDMQLVSPTAQIVSNLFAQATEVASTGNMPAYIPAPQKGIFYKIQIAATRKSPLRTDKFFQEKFQIDQHVDLTEQEGWRKYMIGNFDTYASASDFSRRTKEKIPDAFVVAYKNAQRITIKEATENTAMAN